MPWTTVGKATVEQRWVSYVNKDGPILVARLGPCWLWTRPLLPSGYGAFNVDYKAFRAHVWGYHAYRGEITYELDHLCRNRACVNPWHLEDVPHIVNARRGDAIKVRIIRPYLGSAIKTHCKEGHAFIAENTYTDRQGHRHCRQCRRATQAKFENNHRGYDAAKHRRLRKVS